MPRLFVAVVPPDDVLDAVAALERPPVSGLRWTSREQWHVTLRFLGTVADAGPVVEALSGIALPAATAVVGPAVGRFGHRLLHVPVAGLDEAEAVVRGVTADLGEPPEDRPFRGHLTLARVTKGVRVDLRALAGAPVEGQWAVTEIALVESRLSAAGARYSVVATLPTQPGR
jgi:2'-5' RNA ligase